MISLAAVLPTNGCERWVNGPSRQCCGCVLLVCFQKFISSLVVINCAESDSSFFSPFPTRLLENAWSGKAGISLSSSVRNFKFESLSFFFLFVLRKCKNLQDSSCFPNSVCSSAFQSRLCWPQQESCALYILASSVFCPCRCLSDEFYFFFCKWMFLSQFSHLDV